MYKSKSIIVFLLFITILCNASIVFATNIQEEYKQIEEIGEKIGYLDGLSYKYRPREYEVLEKYESYFEDDDYIIKEYFLDGYYKGFEKSYKEDNDDDSKDVKPIEYADSLGRLLGDIYGNKDSYDKRRYNPTKSLPSNSEISRNYNLDNLSSKDRSEFLNIFKESFAEGYREGFNKSNFDSIKTSLESGINDGEYFGNTLGRINGLKDYFDDKIRDYERDMPSNKSIEEEYSLERNGEQYKEGFLAGFKSAYEESYNESFRNIKVDESIDSYENGYESGRTAGLNKGETYAIQDYYLNQENNWREHFPDKESVIIEYNLLIEDEAYRDSFMSGYLEGFTEGYRTTFQELYNETIVSKTKIETIPISGGEIKSDDDNFSIHINKGTYYNPVVISLSVMSSNPYYIEDKMIKASDIYSINILNKSDEAYNKEDIELSFEYYGKDNGGIYKLVDNEWLYIPSKIEEGYIRAEVKPTSFSYESNIYCVFVDKDYKLLYDIRSHWAKDEILAFQRRGIVAGYPDRTFKPDKDITKGEFFIILSKIYDWDILDSIIVQAMEDPYGLEEPISYNEVESVMRNSMGLNEFNWNDISSQIIYEKLYKSKSYNNMNNNMTRAEAIYMLYILTE